MKNIPVNERLIVALDVSSAIKAVRLVNLIGDQCQFYKLGLELAMTGHYFELVDWLVENGKKVFCDLKFFDIPETVGKAIAGLNGRGIEYVTVHGELLRPEGRSFRFQIASFSAILSSPSNWPIMI